MCAFVYKFIPCHLPHNTIVVRLYFPNSIYIHNLSCDYQT